MALTGPLNREKTMLIRRPEVHLAGGITFRPVSKSAANLANTAAEMALEANSAPAITDLFKALDAGDLLIQEQEASLAAARAAASILIDGIVPGDAPSADLVSFAKRVHDLSEALGRPRDISAEMAQDLADGLEHDLTRAISAQNRAVKRAKYAFAKALVAGCDPSSMSRSSKHASPPASFSRFDLDHEYRPGTRILKSSDREWPAEDTCGDTLLATMTAVICESVLAEHEKQAARKTDQEKLTDRQRERAELQAAADELTATIKEKL